MPNTSRVTFRFDSDELRQKCEERAASKGVSLNEWMNRALAHAVTNGGRLTVTTTIEH